MTVLATFLALRLVPALSGTVAVPILGPSTGQPQTTYVDRQKRAAGTPRTLD